MAKIDTLTITFLGDEIEVDFVYQKGYPGSYYQPPEPEEAEIQAVRVEGEDVTDAVFDEEFEQIEEILLDKIAEYRADMEADQAYERAADRAFWKELGE